MNDKQPPLNREQRRAETFGRADPDTDTPVNEREAHAGRPDQDVVHTTGAGTGGATESDGRVKHHEGQHLGNQPNS